MTKNRRVDRLVQAVGWIATIGWIGSAPLSGQVDSSLAEAYFAQAADLCSQEAGALWGQSLCGPMVFADAATGTIATNRPVPDEPRPRVLGYANTALNWGEERWSTFVWRMVPTEDAAARARLLLHELFHRIQPELGLFVAKMPGECDHLDTPRGRYWLKLEFRALSAALESRGAQREAAIHHALAFRDARRLEFDGAAAREQPSEINEGLAQYTATVAAASTREAALESAIEELRQAAEKESFVRTFAYSTGTAYGLLLDERLPSWRKTLAATDDLAEILRGSLEATSIPPTKQLAERYEGRVVWAEEVERDEQQQKRVRDLTQRFVEGPVLVLPRGKGASFITTGLTSIPDIGAVYPSYRVEGPWGRLEADQVLVSPDGTTLTVPGSFEITGESLDGEGWAIQIAPGWKVAPGPREGDFQIVEENR